MNDSLKPAAGPTARALAFVAAQIGNARAFVDDSRWASRLDLAVRSLGLAHRYRRWLDVAASYWPGVMAPDGKYRSDRQQERPNRTSRSQGALSYPTCELGPACPQCHDDWSPSGWHTDEACDSRCAEAGSSLGYDMSSLVIIGLDSAMSLRAYAPGRPMAFAIQVVCPSGHVRIFGRTAMSPGTAIGGLERRIPKAGHEAAVVGVLVRR